MFNVLVCEDDKNILQLMKIRLERHGYTVFTAKNGQDALAVLGGQKVDLMIVDVGMPVMNGFELIKRVRDSGLEIPSIIVSAHGNLSDKTQGFLLGIDDYMVKPIEFDELVLRIKALLRRAKIVKDNKITVADVVLDFQTLSISDGKDRTVTLTAREFSILFKLLSFPERSFTKGQIFDEFWGYDSNSDVDTVKVFINKIRAKIKIFPEIDVATIRGIGYRGVKNES